MTIDAEKLASPEVKPRKPPKPIRTMSGQDIADFRRNYWFLIVDDDAMLSDFTSPAFWVNNGNKLKKYDQVELVSPSGNFDVLLRIDAVSGGLPIFRVLRQNIVAANAGGSGDHVSFNPGLGLWAAFAAGEMIAEGLADRPAAEAALAEFRGRS